MNTQPNFEIDYGAIYQDSQEANGVLDSDAVFANPKGGLMLVRVQ